MFVQMAAPANENANRPRSSTAARTKGKSKKSQARYFKNPAPMRFIPSMIAPPVRPAEAQSDVAPSAGPTIGDLAPKAKAPEMPAPASAGTLEPSAPPAPQPDYAAGLHALSSSVMQHVAREFIEALRQQLAPVVATIAKDIETLDQRLSQSLVQLGNHVAEGHRQAAETERRQRDAERRSAQEAARQQQIVREREAWQRRISTLTQRAHAVAQRPRAGDRRREAH
jgi:hypothetical protein